MGEQRRSTRFYKIYKWIKARCIFPSHTSYKNYWGRWIKCLWDNYEAFEKDMYESYVYHVNKYWEKDTTIDRIDVNWDYCKENCRWATQKEQLNNTRVNLKIKFNGKLYPSMQILCEYLWLRYWTLYKRVFIEWQDVDSAIYEMTNKKQKYKYNWITYKGITDMCRKLWLNRTSITYRLKIWMSIEDAIETDFRTYNKSRWNSSLII